MYLNESKVIPSINPPALKTIIWLVKSLLILVTYLLLNGSGSIGFIQNVHRVSVSAVWHIPFDIHFGLQVNPNEISHGVILPCKAKLSLISLSLALSLCCFFCYWFQCLNGYSAFSYCTSKEREGRRMKKKNYLIVIKVFSSNFYILFYFSFI